MPSKPSEPAANRINVAFRVLPSVRERLIQRATAAGISTRAWLEEAVMGNKTHIVARQKPHPDLKELKFQYSRAGNNINQLAHRVNTLHLAGELSREDMERMIGRLEDIRSDLLEVARRAR